MLRIVKIGLAGRRHKLAGCQQHTSELVGRSLDRSWRSGCRRAVHRERRAHNASWITNGKVSAGGVGMEVKNGLAVGWRRLTD
jgi:hypothetical protein